MLLQDVVNNEIVDVGHHKRNFIKRAASTMLHLDLQVIIIVHPYTREPADTTITLVQTPIVDQRR